MAFIVHIYGNRRRQKRLQLRGSVSHMQKDLLSSTSCQVVLAVSDVLSESITGDIQYNVYVYITVRLGKITCSSPGKKGHFVGFNHFCGNNLYARKEIATGRCKGLPP